MSVREYIGARYVPMFAEPTTWDSTKTYEPLTIVLYQGNSFTSRQYVPAGIGIDNDTYWAQTGNYNAQIEQYREEVQTVSGQISGVETDIDTLEGLLPKAQFSSVNTVKKYIDDNDTAIENVLPASSFDSTNTIKKYIDDNDTAIENVLPASSFDSTNTIKKYIDDNDTEIEALLPASSFSSVNTVKKYIDDNVSAINTNIDNNSKFKGKKIIFVGDSFSDASNAWGGWVSGLASYLNCTIYNYAHNGSGFVNKVSTDVPFLEQLQTGITEHPDATDVILYGGNNDANYVTGSGSISTLSTALREFFTYIHDNSIARSLKYHFFLGNFPENRADTCWTYRYYVEDAAVTAGIPINIYPYVNAVQIINNGYYSNSDRHPSVAFANDKLKKFFAQSLLHGYCVPTNVIYYTNGESRVTNIPSDMRLYAQGDKIYFRGGIFTVTKNANEDLSSVKLASISITNPPSSAVTDQGPCLAYIIAGNAGYANYCSFELHNKQINLLLQTDVKTALHAETQFLVFVPPTIVQIPW